MVVFLDRDGVINEESESYVKAVDEWRPIPGSLEAIARLSRAGHTVIIITNQSGVGRGLFDEAALMAIHRRLILSVERLGGTIRAIYFCPHTPREKCSCRKPAVGLIERAERELGVTARNAPLIGDRMSDVQAARQMGCEPILVRTGQGVGAQIALSPHSDVAAYADLSEAVDALLNR